MQNQNKRSICKATFVMQEAWKQQGHEVDNKRIKLESLSIHDRGHSLSPREVKQVKMDSDLGATDRRLKLGFQPAL